MSNEDELIKAKLDTILYGQGIIKITRIDPLDDKSEYYNQLLLDEAKEKERLAAREFYKTGSDDSLQSYTDTRHKVDELESK